MGEPIWVYDVKYRINTMTTREIVKVYGKDMILKKLETEHPNCKIKILEINMLGREE